MKLNIGFTESSGKGFVESTANQRNASSYDLTDVLTSLGFVEAKHGRFGLQLPESSGDTTDPIDLARFLRRRQVNEITGAPSNPVYTRTEQNNRWNGEWSASEEFGDAGGLSIGGIESTAWEVVGTNYARFVETREHGSITYHYEDAYLFADVVGDLAEVHAVAQAAFLASSAASGTFWNGIYCYNASGDIVSTGGGWADSGYAGSVSGAGWQFINHLTEVFPDLRLGVASQCLAYKFSTSPLISGMRFRSLIRKWIGDPETLDGDTPVIHGQNEPVFVLADEIELPVHRKARQATVQAIG